MFNLCVRFFTYNYDKNERNVVAETNYYDLDAEKLLTVINIMNEGSINCECVVSKSFKKLLEGEEK